MRLFALHGFIAVYSWDMLDESAYYFIYKVIQNMHIKKATFQGISHHVSFQKWDLKHKSHPEKCESNIRVELIKNFNIRLLN